MSKAVLMLQNGEIFRGKSFGAEGETTGEVVFNTSMTGYQEILTDPSYFGQMVTMTYPEIGNYGVNRADTESDKVQASGFIVREYSKAYSNYRAEKSLGEYLIENQIVAIEGIDTRRLTRILRNSGAMNGIISTIDFDEKSLKDKLSEVPPMSGQDLVPYVTIEKAERFGREISGGLHVVALHGGIKTNILRLLNEAGCNITVVPFSTTAEEILALQPDGVFLSNGPGDPREEKKAVETVQKLLGKIPLFGICLGHQILGLALGGSVYKLKFGHRGANHPVMDYTTGKVEITSHNHGFALDQQSLPEGVSVSHLNLNDQTVSGISCKDFPAFSVQYHPEASPGPHDSHYLFDRFIQDMKAWKK